MSRILVGGLWASLLLPLVPGSARCEGTHESILLWPKGAPGESGDVDGEKQMPSRPGDSTIRITDVTRPTISVHRPPAAKDTGTAVLVCPGGAYSRLAYNKEGTEVAEWLNSLGITGIVLKYRVPARKDRPRHQAPLQDAQRALGLVRQRAREWDLDPSRIGVLGFSAGGHLAAALCNHKDRTYEPLDAADQIRCRPDFCLLIYPAYLVDDAQADRVAPELRVTGETPPTFLVQTQDDSARVECSLLYYRALKAAKVPAEMHLYPIGGHGYGLRPSTHLVHTWPQRAEQWLGSLKVLEPKQ
jgi:acetyl esterase/lipase